MEAVDQGRGGDVSIVRGDPSEAKRVLGWAVQIPQRQTLEELLDSWRQRISGVSHWFRV